MSENLSPVAKIAVRNYRVVAQECAAAPLMAHEVHIWHQQLDRESHEIDALRGLLSTDELERARRFRFDADRNKFIVARGTLRTLLGSYANLPPAKLDFAYSKYGRPSLVNGKASVRLEFNISHSGGLMLLAFASDRRIGVDVEKVRRDFSTVEIAERFFSEAERCALRELPREQRHEAFFRCWTRKEAFIKALGEGLSHPLDQFDVSIAPGMPPALLATRPDGREVTRWTLRDVEVPGDYAATLAAEVVPPPA